MILPFVCLLSWWVLWLVPVRMRTRRASGVGAWWKLLIYYGILTSLLLYSGIATMGVYYDATHPLAVVTKEAMVYIGPESNYAVRGSLQSGSQVRVMKRCGTWCKIQQGTLVGWIAADCI